tara:strand:- start:267 stop:440 length:174 start_codon:yes stop_codon:yes gene_type:complete
MIKFLFKSAVILFTLFVLFLISMGGLSDLHTALSVSDEESGAIFQKEDVNSWDTVQR